MANIHQRKIDIIVYAVCLIAVIGMFIYAAAAHDRLPEQIPTQFGILGKISGYGSRNSVFTLPGVLLVLLPSLIIVGMFPAAWNLPRIKVTEANAPYIAAVVRNMLDIMLIMRGIADPKTALRCKNIYEYAKISRIASNQLSNDTKLKGLANDAWTIEGTGRIYGDACLPSDYLKFMKMTPQAIICTGLKARVEFYSKGEPIDLLPWSNCQWLINNVLENNTRPLLEVELYTLKEMEVRRRIVMDLQDKWEKDNPGGRSSDYAECPVPECECGSPVGGV